MPALNDMIKIYAGSKPVTKVYAGKQLVWNGAAIRNITQWGSSPVWGGAPDNSYWIAKFESDVVPSCAVASSQYSYSVKGGGLGDKWCNWLAWNQGYFGGWSQGVINTGNDPEPTSLYLLAPSMTGLAVRFRRILNGVTYIGTLDYADIIPKAQLPVLNPDPSTIQVCAAS